MTNERAKSELMQLYGSLSEEKKQALDVLMAQADGKYINIQDAISEIREMAKWHTGDAFNADRVIQHLKQLSSVAIPSAEPSGDLISRVEAIKSKMQEIRQAVVGLQHDLNDYAYNDALEDVLTIIDCYMEGEQDETVS